AVYTGRGSVFDTGKIETVPDQRITVTQRVRGNVEASERSGNAVWDVITTVDTDESLPAADPHDALDFNPHRWVLDRRTTKPVHCCGETPRIEGEAYLKFPFDVQKRSYQWWDNTLGDTVVLKYRGTKKVQGYTGYRFTGSVPPTKAGTRLVPGSIVDQPGRPQVLAEEWYANHGVELVVDQRTGRVIYAQTGPKRTLRAPGADKDAAVLLDAEKIPFTTASQREAVRQAEQDSGRAAATPRGAGRGHGRGGAAGRREALLRHRHAARGGAAGRAGQRPVADGGRDAAGRRGGGRFGGGARRRAPGRPWAKGRGPA